MRFRTLGELFEWAKTYPTSWWNDIELRQFDDGVEVRCGWEMKGKRCLPVIDFVTTEPSNLVFLKRQAE